MYSLAYFHFGISALKFSPSRLYSSVPPDAVPAVTSSCAVPLYVSSFAFGASQYDSAFVTVYFPSFVLIS